MLRQLTCVFAALLQFCPFLVGAQEPLFLENGNIIDTKNGEVVKNLSVLIKEGEIRAAGKSEHLQVPGNADTLNVEGQYLLPGLMDAHVHFFQSGGLYTRPDIADLRHIRSYTEEQKWIDQNMDELLAGYIRNGVTSVMDVGGPMKNFRIRDSLSNEVPAPNIFLTGPLISTYQPSAFKINDPPIIKAHSKKEARELVRKQLPYNPDFIKIWYIVTPDQSAKDNLPIIKAVIDESHKHDLKVAVHATEMNTARLAVEAGCDLLVHSVMNAVVDEPFLELLKSRNIDYIPTLQVMNNYERTFNQQFEFLPHVFKMTEPDAMGTLFDIQHLDSQALPQWLNETMANNTKIKGRKDSIMAENLQKIYDHGINVVTGTDAGNIGTLHGASYFREMALMKSYGLTNKEVLKASTFNGSKLLGATSKTGLIEEGYKADILVLDQNPLDSLHYVRSLSHVIKGGELKKLEEFEFNSPVDLAQRQLNAYNAHNLEAFLACYAENVEVYNFPNDLQYKGLDKMRKTYRRFFDRIPNVHCELVNRIKMGNYVMDREKISGLPNGKIMHATAIYEITDGKIRKVWFMK